VIIKNKGHAPGLALGRHGVSKVSQRLLGLLLHKDLLLVLLDDLLILGLFGDHLLDRLALYMHAIY
jgi:hypothetical protein